MKNCKGHKCCPKCNYTRKLHKYKNSEFCRSCIARFEGKLWRSRAIYDPRHLSGVGGFPFAGK